jgi:hypothetical protein
MRPLRNLFTSAPGARRLVSLVVTAYSRPTAANTSGRSRAMTRAPRLLVFVILAGAVAVSGTACDKNHYDMYLGTDAGADFVAPEREAGVDGAADDGAGTGDQVDAGVVPDAGDQVDAGAGTD